MPDAGVEERPSVLIVDDAPDNIELLKRLLKDEDCEVRAAPSGGFALRAVQLSPPDLILLDIRMPDLDGLEVCARLKDSERTRDIPIIFLTALGSTEDEGRGLELGAVDYITKPFNPGIVRARVRNHLRFVRQRKLLEQLAKLDVLTEIPNRRRFDEELEREWKRALRARQPLSLALADVDHFKHYNDTLGHPAGDRALIAVARCLARTLNRPADLAARYGGEEFALLMPETDEAGARSIAGNLLGGVRALKLGYLRSGVQRQLTVSLGGVTMTPTIGTEPTWLVERADKNLYEAKEGGRNRVVWTTL